MSHCKINKAYNEMKRASTKPQLRSLKKETDCKLGTVLAVKARPSIGEALLKYLRKC